METSNQTNQPARKPTIRIAAPLGVDHWLVSEAHRLIARNCFEPKSQLLAQFYGAAGNIVDDPAGREIAAHRLAKLCAAFTQAMAIIDAAQPELPLAPGTPEAGELDNWH